MTSYPDYHNLRDSLVTNASEQKDYDPFRPGYPRFRLLERWGMTSSASSSQPKPAESEKAQPQSKASVAPKDNGASVGSAATSSTREAPSRSSRRPPDNSLCDRISNTRPAGITYVYVSPENAPPPPELPTGRRSWVSFDSDLWSPTEPPAERGRSSSPFGDAFREPAASHPPTARRETARATSGTTSHLAPSQPSAPPAYLAQRTHTARAASQTSASTSASASASVATTDRFSSTGAHVYAYAEPRAGANPFWCIAYISGVALAADGVALIEEYTLLRLRAPGTEGCNREVRRADEPFVVGGRTFSLATLKRKGLGWLAARQLARLRVIADGLAQRLGGEESYQQWVYDLYCDACEEGLFVFDENTERRMMRGPVR
ncbi:hypothetical protein PsYK624_137060 [Phanerochaete sordida]|uniref:Uncharacterized protein n=1 Tax=Phanerochaete sordida TaxID=48140 RepID=A0A9P3GQ35_9APHY|nr:hypothetical protein PsYK624_137060 [Phanerochaete sordida]